MKPIGHTNMFTGRIEKKVCHIKEDADTLYRVVYERADGSHVINYKGKWIPVIQRGEWGDWYEQDGSTRKYRVYFEMIDHCVVDVDAESEADAIEYVQNRLYEDDLEDWWRDAYETRVNDAEELE